MRTHLSGRIIIDRPLNSLSLQRRQENQQKLIELSTDNIQRNYDMTQLRTTLNASNPIPIETSGSKLSIFSSIRTRNLRECLSILDGMDEQ